MDLGIFQFIQVSPSKLPAGKELLSGKELLAGNDPFPKNNLQKMIWLKMHVIGTTYLLMFLITFNLESDC